MKFDIELNLDSEQFELLKKSLEASSHRHKLLLKRVKDLHLESKTLWAELDEELKLLSDAILSIQTHLDIVPL